MSDICSFKQRLIVYSPFMTEARLALLLPAFVDAINKGKQIIVVTKALSDRGRIELTVQNSDQLRKEYIMELRYKQMGDYLYPDLELPEQTNYSIGKYGKLHLEYLKKQLGGHFFTFPRTKINAAHFIRNLFKKVSNGAIMCCGIRI